jgi:undecaprenyl-diphosphatase
VSTPESPYLAVVVGLHVATALAMIFFWRDWARIIGGFLTSLRNRQSATADQKLAWMIVLASIPLGISGLALEHLFRVVFSKAVPTALFVAVNGVILLAAAAVRAAPEAARQQEADPAVAADRRLAAMGYGKAIVIGTVQVFALLRGISRDGIVPIAGMFRGLSREDAVRYSFLLSAPVILAAGVLKIPDLFGPLGAGIHG